MGLAGGVINVPVHVVAAPDTVVLAEEPPLLVAVAVTAGIVPRYRLEVAVVSGVVVLQKNWRSECCSIK